MMLRALALLIMTGWLALPLQARAQELPIFSAKDQKCSATRECMAMKNVCGDAWMAINRANEKKTRELWTTIDVACKQPTPVLDAEPGVTCDAGICKTIEKNCKSHPDTCIVSVQAGGNLNAMQTCSTKDECVIADSVCGRIDAVNKARMQEWKLEVQKLAPVINCLPPPSRPGNPVAACIDHTCKVKE